MDKLKEIKGMEYNGINYKVGRFGYLFMFIGGRWLKSEFNISCLIQEARRIKSGYFVNEFTECYNKKLQRENNENN